MNRKLLSAMQHELGKARNNVKIAREQASTFGRFGDCGSEYESDYRNAKAVCEYLESLLPKLEAMVKPVAKNPKTSM